MGMILGWLLKTALGRIIGGVVGTTLLSGMLYAGCQVKACISHKAEVKAKTAEQTLKIHQADEKSKKQIEEMTDEELAEFARTGVMPERLRSKH